MTTNRSLRALAIVRSTELQQQLLDALSDHPRVRLEVRVSSLRSSRPELLQGEAADVLLLEVDVDDAQDMAALNRIAVEADQRQLPVLTTARDLTTAGLRRLLREAVADFLPQPLNRSELLDALHNAAQSRRKADARGQRGRIITFARASGGVGSTTLAVNTAHALLEARRREGASVCLIDFDVQFGTAALQLDLEPLPGILEMVQAPERLDAALFLGSLADRDGLRVLTAPPTPMPLDALRPELAAELLEFARSEFDYVVLDLPLALTSWTETVLTRCDLLFLVTQLNVPAVRQLRRLLDTLQEEGLYSLPLKLVVNRDRGGLGWGAGVRRRQAEKALDRAIDYAIPDEPDVVLEAINQGRPVVEIKRRCGFSKRLRAMVERSLADLPAPPAPVVAAAA